MMIFTISTGLSIYEPNHSPSICRQSLDYCLHSFTYMSLFHLWAASPLPLLNAFRVFSLSSFS